MPVQDLNAPTPTERSEARALLANPGFNLAVSKVRDMFIEEWRSSSPDDVAGRERMYVCAGTLDEIVAALQAVGNGVTERDVRESVKRMKRGARNG